MALPNTLDVTERGLSRLISQWKDKVVVQGITKALLDNIQVIEDQNQQVLTERGIYEAVGVQLDVIGLLVGEARQGKDDTEYRAAILNRIAINSSNGTPVKMMEILSLLTESDNVKIWEHPTASAFLFADRGVTNATAITVEEIAPAGVKATLLTDVGGNSLICSDLTIGSSSLVTDATDQVVTDAADNIVVASFLDVGTGTNSFLPNLGDPLTNPLCDVVTTEVINYESGYILDESSNHLITGDGDRIRYQIT